MAPKSGEVKYPPPVWGVLVMDYVKVLKEVYVKVFFVSEFSVTRDGRDGSYAISKILRNFQNYSKSPLFHLFYLKLLFFHSSYPPLMALYPSLPSFTSILPSLTPSYGSPTGLRRVPFRLPPAA